MKDKENKTTTTVQTSGGRVYLLRDVIGNESIISVVLPGQEELYKIDRRLV
jgi:hypothetical protein